jgi:hypothetical protein
VPDIQFSCPECRQPMAVSPEAVGMSMQCPGCRRKVVVPRIATSQEAIPAQLPHPARPSDARMGGSSQQTMLKPPPPPPASPPSLPQRPPPVAESPPAATIACPRCHAQLGLPERARGKLVRCGGCGNDFDALASSGAASPPPATAAVAAHPPLVSPAPSPSPDLRIQIPTDGSARVFDPEGQWGTVANSFHPAVIYQGTRLNGDISLPMAIVVSDAGVELGLRVLTPGEVRSFVVQYLPWLIGALLAPIQHLFGLAITPVMVVISLLNPFAIPLVIMDGIGHAVSIVPSIVLLFTVVPNYAKAVAAMFSGAPFTFVPTAVPMEDGRVASLSRGQCVQVIRLDVSDRLVQRVIKKIRKAEEEEMGLVGIVIGFVQLSLLPITIPLSILGGILRLFGVGRTRRAMFAFVLGNPVDLQAPTGFLSRFKKARGEAAAQEGRTIFLVNVPAGRAEELGQAVGRALGVGVETVDDARAKNTIWRGHV